MAGRAGSLKVGVAAARCSKGSSAGALRIPTRTPRIRQNVVFAGAKTVPKLLGEKGAPFLALSREAEERKLQLPVKPSRAMARVGSEPGG